MKKLDLVVVVEVGCNIQIFVVAAEKLVHFGLAAVLVDYYYYMCSFGAGAGAAALCY